VSTVSTWDPKWGALNANLEAEGFNSTQIDEAKNVLTDVINRGASVTAETRGIYAKVFPKNRIEIVKTIKEELLNYTEQKILGILAGPSEPIRESVIEDLLLKMSQLGEPEGINLYFYHIFSTHGDEKTKVEGLVNEVFRQFADGAPTSLTLVTQILSKRNIGHVSLAHLSPMSDALHSFQILQHLADLGVSYAMGRLGWAYTYNDIGSSPKQVKLGLSMKERLEGIRRLALAGHAMSQYHLGFACFHKKLGHDSINDMDEGVRRMWVQELWDHEVPHNYYLTSIVQRNKVGDLPCGLSLEQRFNILLTRAKEGDNGAFAVLFEAYKNNRLDEENKEEPSLNLTQDVRKNKLEELKAVSPGHYDMHITSAYRDNRLGNLETHFSDAERLKWLEEHAVSQLIDAYAKNELISFNYKAHIKLNMSIERRIAKLTELANKGYQSAQFILLQYYGYGGWSDVEHIVSDPQEAKVPDPLTPRHLLRWALQGNTHDCLVRHVCKQAPSQEKALTYLFGVRTAVQRLYLFT
jgi:hypothetical protein